MRTPHPEPPVVSILLPVYNGARFLEAQLDSLLAQTHHHWVCLIRNDGSEDASEAILQRYRSKHPRRFVLLEDVRGNVGTVASLNLLARHSESPYFAPCDQDDVWLPQKLERSISAVTAFGVSSEVPALVFCDMTVTDHELRPIHPSFWDLQNARRYAVGLRGMPVFNAVAGCTMLGNRALLSAAFPVPAEAPMHDHWLALVARYSAVYSAIEEPMVLYRQHGRNQRGAAQPPSLSTRVLQRIAGRARFVAEAKNARRTRLAMLEECLARDIPGARVEDCRHAIRSERSHALARLTFLMRSGIHPAHAFIYWMA